MQARSLASPCPPQGECPAPPRSHAARSLATRPQREPGRRNLSTCLINGGAETAAQTGPRQPHKEEAPLPLPPCIDPSPLWLGQRERRLVGTRPILIRGEPPRGPLAPALSNIPSIGSRPQIGGWGIPSLSGDRVGSERVNSAATQTLPPEDPPVCPSGSVLSPWLPVGLLE